MRFIDVYAPENIKGFPTYAAPRFFTDLVETASGDESANENWENALQVFRLPKAIRDFTTYKALRNHWYCMRGPARLWPFRDNMDYGSADPECLGETPVVSGDDQAVGKLVISGTTRSFIPAVGDNVTTVWQLIKTYEAGDQSYVREIQLPIVASVVVTIGGATPAAASGGPYAVAVEREGGALTITPAVVGGLAIRAGFLFDVPVRFETDTSLEGIIASMGVSGFADLTLIERRLC